MEALIPSIIAASTSSVVVNSNAEVAPENNGAVPITTLALSANSAAQNPVANPVINPIPIPTLTPVPQVNSVNPTPKRKYNSSGRKFKPSWLVDYFMVEKANGVICLICQKALAGKKKHNISRHYRTTHEAEYKILTGKTREEIAHMMKNSLLSQGTIVQNPQLNLPSAEEITAKLSVLFASNGVSFSNGLFIKQCLEVFSIAVYPDALPVVHQLNLTPETIAQQLKESSSSITESLLEKTKQSPFYSLTLCSGINMEDPSQLALFVKGFSQTSVHFEELLEVFPINNSTSGSDILNFVKSTLSKYSLPVENICGITTDRAPVMNNIYTEFVTIFMQELPQEIFVYNNLFYQDQLCDNVLSTDHIVTKVIAVAEILKTRSESLERFQHFLAEFDMKYYDSTSNSLKRFNRYNFLAHFWTILDEAKFFVMELNSEVGFLNDQEWVNDLAFLIDITKPIESFFISLHDRTLLIDKTLHQFVTFFQNLKHLHSRLLAGDLTNFPCLSTRSPQAINFEKYCTLITGLIYLFDNNFSILLRQSEDIDIFSNPFGTDVYKVQHKFQLELIDVQSNPEIKRAFLDSDLLTFYTQYLNREKFPMLYNNAFKLLTLFGSIFTFEKTFSKLKQISNNLRPIASNDQLVEILRIATAQAQSLFKESTN